MVTVKSLLCNGNDFERLYRSSSDVSFFYFIYVESSCNGQNSSSSSGLYRKGEEKNNARVFEEVENLPSEKGQVIARRNI